MDCAAAPSCSCTATATRSTSWPRPNIWRVDIGFTQISVSHRVSPLMKLVPRGDTTVVDAYLSPILRRYVDGVAGLMPGVPLFFMQSSGGLTQAHRFHGKDAILSGPAGGIVGMARTAQAGGHSRAHRLRHGRHVHRREPFCRRIRAHVRHRSRRGARSRAHDEHSQHRGRRRIHHPLRWRAAARGTRIRGCRPRTRELSAWRPARPLPMRTFCSAASSRNSFRRCSAPRRMNLLDRRRRWRGASPSWRSA